MVKTSTEANAPVDRRKTRRYRFNGGALAVFKPEPVQLGQIVDIGMGGLAVRFIKNSDRVNDYSSLTILLDFPNKTIDDIPIRTVSEFKVEDAYPDEGKLYQRCMAFGNMTGEQQQSISRLICDHACGETEDRRWRHNRRSNEDRWIAVEDDPSGNGNERRSVRDRRDGGNGLAE